MAEQEREKLGAAVDCEEAPLSGPVPVIRGDLLRAAAVRVALGAARRNLIMWTEVDDVAHDGVIDYLKQHAVGGAFGVDPLAAVVQATRFRIFKRMRSKKRQTRAYEIIAAMNSEVHETDLETHHMLARIEVHLVSIIENEDIRKTFILREFRLLPEEEISARLQVPLGTVKSRLHRARKYIQDWLDYEAGTAKSSK